MLAFRPALGAQVQGNSLFVVLDGDGVEMATFRWRDARLVLPSLWIVWNAGA